MPNLVPNTMNDWMRRRELASTEVAQRKSDLVAHNIADTVNLDDFLWSGRYYRQSATGTTTALGYPQDGAAGTLEVIRNPASIEAQQVFHDRVSGVSWIRWYDGVSWGPWMSGGSEAGGLWQPYTPALGGITLGNGTVTARFTENGKTVHFWVNFVLGTTSSVDGTIEIGTPSTGFTTTGFVYPMGTALAKLDGATGSNVFKGFTTNGGDGPVTVARIVAANGTNGGLWGPTVPFSWSDGDTLALMAMYEAA